MAQLAEGNFPNSYLAFLDNLGADGFLTSDAKITAFRGYMLVGQNGEINKSCSILEFSTVSNGCPIVLSVEKEISCE